jgi:hypothetical protein
LCSRIALQRLEHLEHLLGEITNPLRNHTLFDRGLPAHGMAAYVGPPTRQPALDDTPVQGFHRTKK